MKVYSVRKGVYYNIKSEGFERLSETGLAFQYADKSILDQVIHFDPISTEEYESKRKKVIELFLPQESSQYLRRDHDRGTAYVKVFKDQTLVANLDEDGRTFLEQLNLKEEHIKMCVPISENEYINGLIDIMNYDHN